MFKSALRWIVKRAKEKSTWAGLATVAMSVGAPSVAPLITAIGSFVGGALVAHKETPSQ